MTEPLLEVRDLCVRFPTKRGVVRAVQEVSFDIRPGERVAIVGESGSGKSVTASSVVGLVPPPGRIVSGSIKLEGRELVGLDDKAFAAIRGNEVGLVLQNPQRALDPLRTIGSQISEPLRLHRGRTRTDAAKDVIELLRQVRIGDPERRAGQYGHQMSGGMSQRAAIASVIGPRPKLLIADEPTSALDATTQEAILELIGDLAREQHMAVALITHDLGVVARFAERVIVMYAGRIVEEAPVEALFARPRHPYTRGLLDSVPGTRGRRAVVAIPGAVPDPVQLPEGCSFNPRCRHAGQDCLAKVPALLPHGASRAACHHAGELAAVLATPSPEPADAAADTPARERAGDDLVVVRDLERAFDVGGSFFRKGGTVRAVDGISFEIRRGEVLALVGESGSGKSTTARILLGLDRPTAGSVRFDGKDVLGSKGRLADLRRRVQVVFQNPDSSLDPRMRAGDIISEPLKVNKIGTPAERRKRAAELLELVGLRPDYASRYPHEFSGGQRQRIAIARALALQPDLIVCDEPVTALDVSIQAQILNLLQDIQKREGLTYLFIAHDLSVVRQLADRVAVMYLGQIVEVADADDFFAAPRHPYSVALLSAMATLDPVAERERERITIPGTVPSPLDPPSGCRFHTRCWKAGDACRAEAPPLEATGGDRLTACFYPEPPPEPASSPPPPEPAATVPTPRPVS